MGGWMLGGAGDAFDKFSPGVTIIYQMKQLPAAAAAAVGPSTVT
jgi:hypothetical protein